MKAIVDRKPVTGIRTWLQHGPLIPGAILLLSHRDLLENAPILLHYACEHPSKGRPRVKADVEKLVATWRDVIIGLSTAHSKEEYERWDFDMDDLLAPILKMPVAQLREFWPKLRDALKMAPGVPYFVWKGFALWGEGALENAPDEDVIELKTTLARQVARMVERDVKPQIGKALVNALKWRSEEDLRRVKESVERGRRPRGRQSCLYLRVGRARVML